MPKSIRIVPWAAPGAGHPITFVLAIGSVRQQCRLQTTFRTRTQALNYLRKHRNAFERIARERLALGEIEDGVIQLTML